MLKEKFTFVNYKLVEWQMSFLNRVWGSSAVFLRKMYGRRAM